MIRGTTPSIRIKMSGYEVDKLSTIHVTLRQQDVILTKTDNEIEIDPEENEIEIKLTQEDTLMFNAGVLLIQVRAVTLYDDAIASAVYETTIGQVLEEGVI